MLSFTCLIIFSFKVRWKRSEEQKGLTEYVAVDERLRKEVDARIIRGVLGDLTILQFL